MSGHVARLRVTHVITGLETGGAEMMLYRLLSSLDPHAFQSEVISLLPAGPVASLIRSLGLPVRSLDLARGVPDPRGVARLTAWLKRARPQVVQTWLYHANLLGGLAARAAGRIPVAWGLHQTVLDARETRTTTRWAVRAGALLSYSLPTRIVCCAVATADVHRALGYAARKLVVIPNGFDVDVFRPDADARASVRAELGVAADAPLVGLVARFDPHKDHQTFAAAAGRLGSVRPDAHFLLCGEGVSPSNARLVDWLDAAGVGARCHLLGRRDDVPRLTAALDVATSASYSEAFPLVVGEAMACAVPCVVTDVGDSARVVGPTGRVVSPRAAVALADAWADLLAMPAGERARLGHAARARVERTFALPAVGRRYAREWATLAGAAGTAGG